MPHACLKSHDHSASGSEEENFTMYGHGSHLKNHVTWTIYIHVQSFVTQNWGQIQGLLHRNFYWFWKRSLKILMDAQIFLFLALHPLNMLLRSCRDGAHLFTSN